MSEVKNQDQPVYDAGDQAIIERAKTILFERMYKPRQSIVSTTDSMDLCTLLLREKDREVFGVLYLDNNHGLIEFVELSVGTVDKATVYPREVIRKGLQLNAVAMVLTHNHPSGASKPSQADKTITNRIIEVAHLVDMHVLDHIVVGNDCYSFAQMGDLH